MILDASALIDSLVEVPRSRAVREQVAAAPFLAAPELVLVETTSALWRLVRAGALDADGAARAVAELVRLDIELLSHRELVESAWAFRHATRISDAFYLASAHALGVALLTTDARLARGHHGVSVVLVA